MQNHKPLPTVANVAKGNDISVTLRVGSVYEQVMLFLTDITPAQCKNITLELNGRVISSWKDGTRLNDIDGYFGRESVTGALVFNFNRKELHQLSDRRFYGLDTSKSQGIQTAAIKMTIDAAAGDNADIKGYAKLTQAVQGAPNFLTKVRTYPVNVSAAGQFEIDSIPRPAGATITSMHLFGDCDVDKAELLIDNTNWHDVPNAVAAEFQKTAHHKRTPKAGVAHMDFVLDGDMRHGIPLTQDIQDFRLRCNAQSAGQCEVVVEYVDVYRATGF